MSGKTGWLKYRSIKSLNKILKNTTLVFLIVFVSSAFLLFFKLGDRGLRNPDEGRYAEIAKEMVLSGNWIEPKLYGVDYLRKPALFYWLVALSFKWTGFSEGSARAVPALFGILGVCATFFFAKRFFDLKTAFYSSMLLISNYWYLQIGRYLLIDMVFSFFLVAGLYLFYLGTQPSRHKRLYYALFYVCISLSVLAKGIVGLALSAVSITLTLLWTRQLKEKIVEMNLGLGMLIFGILVGPWFFKMESLRPGFLNSFFLHEHLMRLVSKDYEHQAPWYFYLVLFPVTLVPWIFFGDAVKSAFSFLSDERSNRARLFLTLSALAVIFVYSLSNSKLLTYMLPAVFFASVLLGHGFNEWEKAAPDKSFGRFSMAMMALLSFAAILALFAVPLLPSFAPDLEAGFPVIYLEWIGGLVLAGSLLGWACLKKRRPRLFFGVFVMVMAGVSFVISDAMEDINDNYSTRHFARDLKSRVKAEDEVFIYRQPGAFYDFGFYLDHPVKLVGLEGELELSKKEAQNQNTWVAYDEFEKILKQRKKVYCLIRKSDFLGINETIRKNLEVISQDERKVLFQTRASTGGTP